MNRKLFSAKQICGRRRGLELLSVACACAGLAPSCGPAREAPIVFRSRARLSVDPPVVISQVYGGGSNSGAPLQNDFVELFNRSSAPIGLDGWSVQYASATGTALFSSAVTSIAGTLQPGQYYLVALAGGTVGLPLPTADAAGTTAMSATSGKVVLVSQAAGLACNGGSTPCDATAESQIVDLVGYGSANFAETAAAPALSNTAAALRLTSGCVDTNDNAVDFVARAPSPRNTSSPMSPCGSNPGPGAYRVHDVQGRSHLSPLLDQVVSELPGIVTVVRNNGFYLQDPTPDDDDATSEGVFVYTTISPTVQVGDEVLVTGPVAEFRPSCSACGPSSSAYSNLTTTEINRPTAVVVLSSGNPLPPPVAVGPASGERSPPTEVIEDDANGNVESPGALFDPATDGIDFYESLEGMRVSIEDAVVVGPTATFSDGSRELVVVSRDGAGATGRTARSGIVISAADSNPERIVLADSLGVALPGANVGDRLPGATVGVVDYSSGNYKLLVSEELPILQSVGLGREVSSLGESSPAQLTVATLNAENLDPGDGPDKFAALASILFDNLKAPDLVALEELQDNNGATDDGVVDAGRTLSMLVDAIVAAGGPRYDARQIDPENDRDGGEQGGNIRVAFLFRSDRGLAFVDRPGAAFDTPNEVLDLDGAPSLRFSPGRVDPTNVAFTQSRKPLAGELRFNGQSLFVIANHFNSKGGDQSLFGRFQPPALSSETQRLAQAQVVASFVGQIRTIDSAASIVVLGDLNDFEFSAPVAVLKEESLTPLIETLPPEERYTYVYQGNSQALDHILVSPSLLDSAEFDVVHVNAEFMIQTSDHDPSVSRFTIGSRPHSQAPPSRPCRARASLVDTGARRIIPIAKQCGRSWHHELESSSSRESSFPTACRPRLRVSGSRAQASLRD